MQLTTDQIKEILKEKMDPANVVADHDYSGHWYKYVPVNERYASVTTKSSILDSPHLKKWAAGLAVEHIDKNWEIVARDKGVPDDLRKAAVMAHEDVLQDAGGIGTQGHEAVERYLLKWMEDGVAPKDITKFITGKDYRLFAIARSAEQFCKDFYIEPLASEMKIAHSKHQYGGTLDSLMMVTKILKSGENPCTDRHDWWYSGAVKRKMQCSQCGTKAKKIFALVDWKTSNSVDKPEYAMQGSAYWYALSHMSGLKPEEIIIVQLDKYKLKYSAVRVVDRVKAFKAFVQVGKVFDWLNDGVSKILPYKLKRQIFLD